MLLAASAVFMLETLLPQSLGLLPLSSCTQKVLLFLPGFISSRDVSMTPDLEAVSILSADGAGEGVMLYFSLQKCIA